MAGKEMTYINCIAPLSQSIDVPVAIFDASGRLVGCTHPERTLFAQQIFHLCQDSNATPEAVATLYNVEYGVLSDQKQAVQCYLLLLDAAGRKDLLARATVLLRLDMQRQALHSQLHHDSNSRISFVYRLLNAEPGQRSVLKTQAEQLHYDFALRRCVILFEAGTGHSESSTPGDFAQEENRLSILQALSNAPGYDANDIGDFSNLDFFTLFKYVPEGTRQEQHAYLQQFAAFIAESMLDTCGLRLKISIGTCYGNLLMMRDSNREAQFISSNFHFFSSGEQVLFADDHIFDYLSSLLPKEYYEKKFTHLREQLQGAPALSETLISLSKNDSHLLACAGELKVHRNTMLQRYAKIREHLGLDPLTSDRDRMNIRQYALFHNRKTVLHAGITIQGQSILNQLCRKFAELIEEKSGGTLALSVHTVSLSGDNASLFEVLQRGDIDVAVGNIDALCPLIGNDISLLDLPFLFDSAEEGFSILQGEVGQALLEPVRSHGMIGLGYWSMGWRYFSSKNQLLRLPEDFRGKKIRIMQKKPVDDFMRYLGATPVHVSYNNILSALQSGIIESQENPYRNFYDMQFSLEQNQILEMNIFLDCNALLASRNAQKKLAPEQWEIVQQAALETNRWNREAFLSLTTECREKILRAGGVEIHSSTPQEIAVWKQTCSDFAKQYANREVYCRILKAKEEFRAKSLH